MLVVHGNTPRQRAAFSPWHFANTTRHRQMFIAISSWHQQLGCVPPCVTSPALLFRPPSQFFATTRAVPAHGLACSSVHRLNNLPVSCSILICNTLLCAAGPAVPAWSRGSIDPQAQRCIFELWRWGRRNQPPKLGTIEALPAGGGGAASGALGSAAHKASATAATIRLPHAYLPNTLNQAGGGAGLLHEQCQRRTWASADTVKPAHDWLGSL